MSVPKILQRLFRQDTLTTNAMFLWGSTIVGSLTGFLFWNIAARRYSYESVALASAVISLALLLAGIAGLGFGSGIVRFFHGNADPGGMLNTVLTFTFLSSIVFAVACVLGAGFWAPSLAVLQSAVPFGVFLLLVVATAQNFVFQMVFLSLQKADFTFAVLALVNVLRLGFLLLLPPHSEQEIIFSLAAATVLANGFGLWAVNRLVNPYRPRPAVSGSILRHLVPFSLANGIADFIFRIPALVGPVVVLELLGEQAGAHFYIAWIIGAALTAPGLSFAQSAFAEGASDPLRLPDVIARSIVRGVIITLAASAAIGVLAAWILSLFGGGYPSASEFLRWLCVAAPFGVVNSILFTAFRVQNRLGTLILLNALIVILFFAPLGVFPAVGLSGIGVIWLGSQILAAAASAVAYFRARRFVPASVSGGG